MLRRSMRSSLGSLVFLLAASTLSACGGGSSQALPGAIPSRQITKSAAVIGHGIAAPVANPTTLSFTALGAVNSKTFVVSVQFAGDLTAASSNTLCATVSPEVATPSVNGVTPKPSDHGMKAATFTVTPVGNGTCTITITDKKGATATVAVTVAAGPLYPAVVLADHPSMYFHLDQPSSNTAVDVSGNGNNAWVGSGIGSIPGAIANWDDTAFEMFGTPSSATDFGGTYAPITSGFTVEAWVKVAEADTAPSTIYAGNAGNCPNIFDVRVSDASGYYIPISAPTGTVSVRIGQGPGNFSTPVVGVLSSIPINDGEWHYVVATWNAAVGSPVSTSQFHVFIDGRDETGQGYSFGNLGLLAPIQFNTAGGKYPSTPYCNANVAAGWLTASSNENSSFGIDELATYEYALTPAQILHHYEVGVGSSSAL